jgi:hypothetical protein
MHSVLIVATVDRGHGDSVGGQVGGIRRRSNRATARISDCDTRWITPVDLGARPA